jgi:PA domain
MSATVKTLASDAFEGRAPGTPGEQKTVEYLIHRFQALGLQPAGEHGGWTQQVPLVHNTAGAPTRLEVSVGGSILSLVAGRDISPRTIRPLSQVTIHDAPIVFVGYGVAAPERDWDDFKGFDLHGKVAIFLVNDPHFEANPGEPAARRFGGPAMTYYGRWTYKFEEAARRGAIAALVIHETAAAGYDWKVASSTVVGSYGIVRSADEAQPVLMQAWIARESAVTLFKKAGLDFWATHGGGPSGGRLQSSRRSATRAVRRGTECCFDVQLSNGPPSEAEVPPSYRRTALFQAPLRSQ